MTIQAARAARMTAVGASSNVVRSQASAEWPPAVGKSEHGLGHGHANALVADTLRER